MNITWEDYTKNSKDLLSKLFSTQKFADITLVCDGQTQYKAHKFILSASSKVFESILDTDSNQSCVYLRGISKNEIEAILKFIYLGSTEQYRK